MPDDPVARLRTLAGAAWSTLKRIEARYLLREAADEIERLRSALAVVATYDADQWTHGDDCPVDDPTDAGKPGCTCSTGAVVVLVNRARVALGLPVEARCGGCGATHDACYCASEAEIGA